MKRILLLSVLSTILLSSISSQITHVHFGNEGLAIPMNANFPIDLDNNGVVDLYVNKSTDELGLSPVEYLSCLEGLGLNEKTSWGSYKLRTIEKGETTGMTIENIELFIEDNSAGFYNSNFGLVDGWTDGSEFYLGFAIMSAELTFWNNGWLLVELDIENEKLILKEYAYLEFGSEQEKIVAGDIGATVSTADLLSVLTDVELLPNPATDYINLAYNYHGQEKLHVSILDNQGKEILSESLNGSNTSFDCSDWSAGIYFVNLHSSAGTHTERLLVSK